jgi:hypothetical protein
MHIFNRMMMDSPTISSDGHKKNRRDSCSARVQGIFHGVRVFFGEYALLRGGVKKTPPPAAPLKCVNKIVEKKIYKSNIFFLP